MKSPGVACKERPSASPEGRRDAGVDERDGRAREAWVPICKKGVITLEVACKERSQAGEGPERVEKEGMVESEMGGTGGEKKALARANAFFIAEVAAAGLGVRLLTAWERGGECKARRGGEAPGRAGKVAGASSSGGGEEGG